jgi:HAD superfamily hydrolase (TIGR01662 family)
MNMANKKPSPRRERWTRRARTGVPAKAVFFDRDGTLNVDIHYLHRPEDFIWIDGAKEAIKYVNDQGYLAILVTNQSGVARGFYPESDVKRVYDWMNSELQENRRSPRCSLLLPASSRGKDSRSTAKPAAAASPQPALLTKPVPASTSTARNPISSATAKPTCSARRTQGSEDCGMRAAACWS